MEVKTQGKIPKWLLIIGGLVLLIIIIVAVSGGKEEEKPTVTLPEEKVEEKVTELRIGDAWFKLIEAKDLGSILKGSESKYPEWREDLTTEGKFVKVTITAENKWGKEELVIWGQSAVIDNQGREFEKSYEASDWLPEENECAEGLKPGFKAKSCTAIYEVAADSTGLKVRLFEGIHGGKLILGI